MLTPVRGSRTPKNVAMFIISTILVLNIVNLGIFTLMNSEYPRYFLQKGAI
jgi:hypothetical protein